MTEVLLYVVYEVKNYNCHKNKIRTNEPKIWQNNKNTESQPKLSGSYNNKKKSVGIAKNTELYAITIGYRTKSESNLHYLGE